MNIVRGRYSHTLRDDFLALGKTVFKGKENYEKNRELERLLTDKCGHDEVIFFPFARTAFYFTLKSLTLPEGTEILMPSITIKAMLDVVLDLKLKPVFVDSNPRTGCFDEVSLGKAIEINDPRICLLTYLFGVVPDVESIVNALKKRDIFIIEDFSQAFGASFNDRPLGSFGDVSIYSASAVKTLDTYGGGFAFSSNKELIKKLNEYRTNLHRPAPRLQFKRVFLNTLKNAFSQRVFFSIFVFPILKFFDSKGKTGFNRFVGERSRLPIWHLPKDWFTSYTKWQSVFCLKMLNDIESRDQLRIMAAKRFIAANRKLDFVRGHEKSHSIYWQCIALPTNPKRFRTHLYSFGIDSAMTSLVELSRLRAYGIDIDTPGADYLYEHGVYIPCHHLLKEDEILKIESAIKSFRSD
jgi:dTDP-4-amino-4,6-dideoxygalactose transaminase